jgi:hypothetical protein
MTERNPIDAYIEGCMDELLRILAYKDEAHDLYRWRGDAVSGQMMYQLKQDAISAYDKRLRKSLGMS